MRKDTHSGLLGSERSNLFYQSNTLKLCQIGTILTYFSQFYVGLTTYATSNATSEQANNAVIGSIGFSEGLHYWEIICPIFCNSIGK